jgi:hypothetical protein
VHAHCGHQKSRRQETQEIKCLGILNVHMWLSMIQLQFICKSVQCRSNK